MGVVGPCRSHQVGPGSYLVRGRLGRYKDQPLSTKNPSYFAHLQVGMRQAVEISPSSLACLSAVRGMSDAGDGTMPA